MRFARNTLVPFVIAAALVTLVLVPLVMYLYTPDHGIAPEVLPAGVELSRDDRGISVSYTHLTLPTN